MVIVFHINDKVKEKDWVSKSICCADISEYQLFPINNSTKGWIFLTGKLITVIPHMLQVTE